MYSLTQHANTLMRRFGQYVSQHRNSSTRRSLLLRSSSSYHSSLSHNFKRTPLYVSPYNKQYSHPISSSSSSSSLFASYNTRQFHTSYTRYAPKSKNNPKVTQQPSQQQQQPLPLLDDSAYPQFDKNNPMESLRLILFHYPPPPPLIKSLGRFKDTLLNLERDKVAPDVIYTILSDFTKVCLEQLTFKRVTLFGIIILLPYVFLMYHTSIIQSITVSLVQSHERTFKLYTQDRQKLSKLSTNKIINTSINNDDIQIKNNKPLNSINSSGSKFSSLIAASQYDENTINITDILPLHNNYNTSVPVFHFPDDSSLPPNFPAMIAALQYKASLPEDTSPIDPHKGLSQDEIKFISLQRRFIRSYMRAHWLDAFFNYVLGQSFFQLCAPHLSPRPLPPEVARQYTNLRDFARNVFSM